MKMSDLEKVLVNSDTHARRVSRYAERMLSYVEVHPGARYLDAGCGNGGVLIYLAQKYDLKITGVDIDPDQIAEARIKSAEAGLENAKFLDQDVTCLPLHDDSFDIVATFRMTHHIPAWEDALDELVRVLKPGGSLIYVDFVVPGWVAAPGKMITGEIVGYPTAKRLDAFIARHELRVVHRSHLFSYEVVCQKPV